MLTWPTYIQVLKMNEQISVLFDRLWNVLMHTHYFVFFSWRTFEFNLYKRVHVNVSCGAFLYVLTVTCNDYFWILRHCVPDTETEVASYIDENITLELSSVFLPFVLPILPCRVSDCLNGIWWLLHELPEKVTFKSFKALYKPIELTKIRNKFRSKI